MNIAKRTEYGFQFLIYLANSNADKYIQLGEIAKDEDISIKYLEKVVQIAKRAGLLTVARGIRGGYKLSKNPENICVKDLFYIFEGVNSISNCNEDCGNEIGLWGELDRAIDSFLTGITLKDIAEDIRVQNMYYI